MKIITRSHTTITIGLEEIFESYLESIQNLLDDGDTILDDATELASILLGDENCIRNLFKKGFTFMLMPGEANEAIEQAESVSIRITDPRRGTVFVVDHEDIKH